MFQFILGNEYYMTGGTKLTHKCHYFVYKKDQFYTCRLCKNAPLLDENFITQVKLLFGKVVIASDKSWSNEVEI